MTQVAQQGISEVMNAVGLSELETVHVLVIALGIIMIISVIVVVIKLVLDMAPYAYTNARIQGMRARFLSKSKLEEMMTSDSVNGVIQLLEGTDYETHTSELARLETVTPYQVNAALRNSLTESYRTLMRISPDNIKPIIRTRLKSMDVMIIKAAVRAVHSGNPVKSVIGGAVPGMLSKAQVSSLEDVESVEDLLSKLGATEYAVPLNEVLQEYNETHNIRLVESTLDKYAYDLIWNSIRTPSEGNTRIFRTFIGKEIDLLNLKIIIRCTREGITYDKALDYLLRGGIVVDEDLAKGLLESTDIGSLISMLENTPYGTIFRDMHVSPSDSLLNIELALDNYLVDLATSISTSNPFGIGPVIGYMTMKAAEVRNLTAIVKGIEAGLDIDDVTGILIGVRET